MDYMGSHVLEKVKIIVHQKYKINISNKHTKSYLESSDPS